MSLESYFFQERITKAINEITKLLNTNKTVTLPEDQEHTWADKYTVVESVSNSTIFGLSNCIKVLGFGGKLDLLKPTLLRCVLEETCTFLKKEQKKVSQGGVASETSKGIFKTTSKSEFFSIVDEYHWSWTGTITIYLTNGDKRVDISKQKLETVLVNQAEINPRSQIPTKQEFEVLISDLVSFSNAFQSTTGFKIEKLDEECFTPARNKEIKKLQGVVLTLTEFIKNIGNTVDAWFDLEHFGEVSVVALRQNFEILVPVAPVMVDALPTTIITDHLTSIQNKNGSLQEHILDKSGNADLGKVAALTNTLVNMVHICQAFYDGVNYIEDLLRRQVIQAIGKSISLKDIEEYMVFHYRGLMVDQVKPQPFVSDVRLKGCTPEGAISISCGTEPLFTTSKLISEGHPVHMRLNASTVVNIKGSHHLHGSLTYHFSIEERNSYQLTARARQFSSFIILIGTMVSHTEFQAKHGMIVQNKDEFCIPLLFEAIPSAAEFRDAIKSLSPKQQEFCKLFRKMQLESNTFACSIIQIKPQLERVLNSMPGSLTKEIKLTQDLMKLLLEFQIPTDLLKFDGEDSVGVAERVLKVRECVKAVYDAVEESKKEEAEERKRIAEIERAEEGFLADTAETFTKAKKSSFPFVARGSGALFGGPPAPGMVMAAAPMMMRSAAPPPQPTAPLPKTRGGMKEQVAIVGETFGFNESTPAQPAQPQPTADISGEPMPPSYDQAFDYTKVSSLVDQTMDAHLKEATIRPIIIKHDGSVNHTLVKSLLSKPETKILHESDKKTEFNKALDLLDCLSRSGELDMLHSQVHIFYAVQQSFDDTVMDTIVQKNQNPITQMEKAMVLLAKTIHGKPIDQLIVPNQVSRVLQAFPNLE